MDPLSALIGAGTSLLGGFMNANSTANANAANIAEQNYLASNSIQMKVADAKKAGINPLAALGVNTPSAPTVVGSDAAGNGVAQAGQNIARAFVGQSDEEKKTAALNQALIQAKIENTQADTAAQMLRNSQVANHFGQPGTAPSAASSIPLPTPDPRFDGGIWPGAARFRMADGSIAVTPSEKLTRATFATDPLGQYIAGRARGGDVSGALAIPPWLDRKIRDWKLPESDKWFNPFSSPAY